MKTNPIPAKVHFWVVNQKQKIKIPSQSIVMLEGHINYALIYLQNGRQKLYARPFRHFETLLSNEHFLRVHRGFLINPSFILNYDKESCKLQMENNLEVNISRRKRGCLEGFF